MSETNISNNTSFRNLRTERVLDDNFSYDESVPSKLPFSHSIKNWLYALISATVIILLFSIIYESIQSMFLASSSYNGKPDKDSQAYLDSHSDNFIGLWKQCSVRGCIPLQIYCSKEDIKTSLNAAGLLALANAEQVEEFVNQEAQLCPLIVATRATSILAIFACALALIGLAMAVRRNSKIAFTIATTGSVLMGILTMASMIILINMKSTLDYLSVLGSRYSVIGSNTSNPSIDTVYSYSSGFWLLVVTFVLVILIIPLFFIISNFAKNYRIARNKLNGGEDEYGSSFGSIDFGPAVKNKSSSELKSTFDLNRESVISSNYDPSVGFHLPPMGQSDRNVRFGDHSKMNVDIQGPEAAHSSVHSPTNSRAFVSSIKNPYEVASKEIRDSI